VKRNLHKIKFLLRRTLSSRQASGYYGRTCTDPSGPAAKIGRLHVLSKFRNQLLSTAAVERRGIKPSKYLMKNLGARPEVSKISP
jgi:hypothetical protein